jgi:hypothetical protein
MAATPRTLPTAGTRRCAPPASPTKPATDNAPASRDTAAPRAPNIPAIARSPEQPRPSPLQTQIRRQPKSESTPLPKPSPAPQIHILKSRIRKSPILRSPPDWTVPAFRQTVGTDFFGHVEPGHPPQPSERQVHPTASSGYSRRPKVHTIPSSVHPKVLLLDRFGTGLAARGKIDFLPGPSRRSLGE